MASACHTELGDLCDLFSTFIIFVPNHRDTAENDGVDVLARFSGSRYDSWAGRNSGRFSAISLLLRGQLVGLATCAALRILPLYRQNIC